MTGRPTKLTPETHEAIIRDISNGVTFVDAAGAAGIEYTTFRDWMKKGETEPKGIYHNFYNACQAAKAAARKKFTLVISKAASEGDWRAALEYLKRHDPENWGDKTQNDVNLKGQIETKVIEVRPIDYRSAIAALAPGSMDDSDAPGESKNPGDGPPVG